MINLRYHVVSLVAVFLALGLGVIMGSTVIDRVTVDQLRNQLDRVESSVKQTRKENGQLSGRLRVWDQFADQARDQVLRARLQTVPVLIVGVDGIDHGPVDDLRRQLVNAQATFQGTIWLSSKLRLGSQSDTAGLATALGVPAEQPDVLRRLAVTKIAAVLDGSAPDPNPLPALRDAGFVRYDAPPAGTTTTALDARVTPLPGTRYVVVSGAGAQVDDDQVAIPLVTQLGQAHAAVLAAEAGQDTPGGRGVFVGRLRDSGDVASRLSTVDDLESFMGQAASVLALVDLGVAKVGHYGVGPAAQRLLPAPAP